MSGGMRKKKTLALIKALLHSAATHTATAAGTAAVTKDTPFTAIADADAGAVACPFTSIDNDKDCDNSCSGDSSSGSRHKLQQTIQQEQQQDEEEKGDDNHDLCLSTDTPAAVAVDDCVANSLL